MSSVVIRQVEGRDLPWIVEQVKEFLLFMGGTIPFNEAYVKSFSNKIASEGCSFVAEKDGQLVGVIAGTIQPHYLNPDVLTMNELMWWVVPEHRYSSAGLRLLKALDQCAEDCGVNLSVMSVAAQSKLTGKTLARMGYVPQELSLIKKVA
jgi:N-acetylglutamate synthase-like GNAT family acetyltransferase